MVKFIGYFAATLFLSIMPVFLGLLVYVGLDMWQLALNVALYYLQSSGAFITVFYVLIIGRLISRLP